MNRRLTIFLILYICTTRQIVYGQNLGISSLTQMSVATVTKPLLISDSLTIVPSSVVITNSDYVVLSNSGVVTQNNNIFINKPTYKTLKNKKITIKYRTFPFLISQSYTRFDSTLAHQPLRYEAYNPNKKTPQNSTLLLSDKLDYSGSFARGISVGNAQSFALNSNFNLQLSGDMGNGIKIAAAISDENIPIQPEGSTQLLQEFDRVFIKVSKDRTSIIAGDFPLQRPKSYFTRYFKKVQGLGATNMSNIGNTTITSDAALAVSRGKFARQTLNIKEGNQGPYKLEGNNQERFLIVLSGTEKIYVNGRLLKRGLNYDYTIDYNRAEITFTPKMLVKREHRIIAEFEYTDQNYLRTLYTANSNIEGKNWNVNFNFYSEQDSKTPTSTQFDSIDYQSLALSGDNTSLYAKSGIRTITNSENIFTNITYSVTPYSTSDDTIRHILIYSTDPNESLVNATFSEVSGGRYTIDTEAGVNGRVYKYVGLGNGSYEPIIRLIAPEQRQVMNLGGSYIFHKNAKLDAEISLSNVDKNRLSSLDDSNNEGLATMLRYTHKYNLAKEWKLQSISKYERLSKNYSSLNPYRNADFNNTWNIPTTRANIEHYLTTNISIAKSDSAQLSYSYQLLNRAKIYNGGIHAASTQWILNSGTQFSFDISNLSSDSDTEQISYLISSIKIAQTVFKHHEFGASYDHENNTRRYRTNSILNRNSQAFELAQFYTKGNVSNRINYEIRYQNRTDFLPLKAQLLKAIHSDEITGNILYDITPRHTLKSTFGYRVFNISNKEVVPEQNDKKTLVGALEHSFSKFNGGIVSNLTYTTNSGQQPKVEYYFQEVASGRGDYIYVGEKDSTLNNANFRYAPQLKTGNYIRLSLVNGAFELTNNQVLNYNLRISPERFFKYTKKTNTFKTILSKLSTISTVRINKKIAVADGYGFINFSSKDTSIVQYNSVIRHSLFINRNRRNFDAQLSYRNANTIVSQISGLERRGDKAYIVKSRIKIHGTGDFLLDATLGNRFFSSQLFENKAFDIHYITIAPKISYRPSSNFRIITEYKLDQRNQTILNKETATSNSFAINLTYRRSSSLSLSTDIDYTSVVYDGESGSLIEFDLLQGLKNGSNFLWNVNLTKRLNDSIDITILYEGRKNGDIPTFHTASVQAKATF